MSTDDWPGWVSGAGRCGNPARYWQGILRDTFCGLSWGPVDRHYVHLLKDRKWFGPGALYYADLEVFNKDWASDPESHTACHIERGYRTEAEALAMRDWLRSCVEVAGEAGLRALNERTRGRLA